MIVDPSAKSSYLAWQFSQAMNLRLEKALRPLGMNLAQHNALVQVALSPGISSADVARRSGMTAQSMGQAVNTLVERGLLRREPHPDNRRIMRLHGTDAARELAENGQRALESAADEIFGALDAAQRAVLHTTLRALVAHLNPDALDLQRPSDVP